MLLSSAIVDERFVMIADGDKRKFDQPKKKNVLHLELQPADQSVKLSNSLQETGRVTNAKATLCSIQKCR